DEKGTLDGMRKALNDVAAKTKPDSTFLFYYAGHGNRKPDGSVEFANYDYSGRQPDKPGFAVREVSDILEKKFKGSRVLLMADCCFSGGLRETAKSLNKAKFKAAAVTSADPLCTSTSSWIFTQTVIDCFAGEPFLDTNGDGAITLAELAGEVSLAM